jgi:hypothetical protein
MCEIVRSLLGGGVYEGVKFDDLREIIFDSIECVGEDNESNLTKHNFFINIIIVETQVCAATGGSAAQSYTWSILLEGSSIRANDLPKWELDPRSKQYVVSKRGSTS